MVNVIFDPSKIPNPWEEISGQPVQTDTETTDENIRRVIVAQRREINRKNLPDLDPE